MFPSAIIDGPRLPSTGSAHTILAKKRYRYRRQLKRGAICDLETSLPRHNRAKIHSTYQSSAARREIKARLILNRISHRLVSNDV